MEYVGFSGGPDSVYLLLKQFKLNPNIIAIHINHTNSENNNNFELFCKSFCEEHGIKLICRNANINPNTSNFENTARIKRYQIYSDIINETSCDLENVLYLGHHKDDLIETMLFRFFNNKSLVPIHEVSYRENYKLVRPMLLATTKEEIINYLKKNNISYVIDPSNNECKYERNIIRNVIIPCIKKFFPYIGKTIIDLYKKQKNDQECLKNYFLIIYDRVLVNNRLSINEILKLGYSEQYLLMQNILWKYSINEKKHIEQVISIIKSDSENPHILLKNNDGINVLIFKHKFTKTLNIIVNYKKEEIIPDLVKIINLSYNDKYNIVYGDSKYNKDMSNNKIPLFIRNSWPFVYSLDGELIYSPLIKENKNFNSVSEYL